MDKKYFNEIDIYELDSIAIANIKNAVRRISKKLNVKIELPSLIGIYNINNPLIVTIFSPIFAAPIMSININTYSTKMCIIPNDNVIHDVTMED